MIELELKYKLDKEPELSKFPFIEERKQSDIYYDTKNYDLLKNGNFLRIREGKRIDFKTNLNDLSHLYCRETSFEIKDINEKNNEINNLLGAIGLPNKHEFNNMDAFINENKFIVLASINKTRRTYQITKDLTVYIDDVEKIGLFLEAELELENISSEDALNYKDEITKILTENNLITNDDVSVKIGYVELYLKKYNKTAYELGKYKL